MKSPIKGLWLQIIVVSLVIVVAVVSYQLQANRAAVGGSVSLQRLDLLYLREPAPYLTALGIKNGVKTVVVFCQKCSLPEVSGAQVVISKNKTIAEAYSMVTSSGRIGPGYVIIDSEGQLRYRSYDPDPARHNGEISRLVKGVE